MDRRYLPAAAVLFAALAFLPAFATAATEKNVLYSTDFSSSPKWITNNPTRYYWDPQKEMYHYTMEGGTGGYSYIPVEYDGQSFTLEYDLLPVRTDKDSAFRFGLGSTEMDVTRGTVVLSLFEYSKYGKLMHLKVITQSNHLAEVTSQADSYCGETRGCETKNYFENETYHVELRYNKEAGNAEMKVTYRVNNSLVWGYYVPVREDLHFMKRLMISSIGDYTSTGAIAEGFVDNVELYTPVETTPVPTSTTTVPRTTVPTTTAPKTPTPTPAPTKSPLPAALAAAALVSAGYLAYRSRSRR